MAAIEVEDEDTGEAVEDQDPGAAHQDTPLTLPRPAVTAITSTETKLTTASSPSPAPGSARSSRPNEGQADLAKWKINLIMTPCFLQSVH